MMRAKGVYIVLREYHKWETDKDCVDAIETIVTMLIHTEDEIGTDRLHLGAAALPSMPDAQ